MKKALSVIAAAALMASLLAGCGSSSTATTAAPAASAAAPAETKAGEAAPAAEGYAEKPDKILKFTDQNSADSPVGQFEQRFADLVKEYTNGHIQVDVYPNNTLCGYDIQPLQAGIADFSQYVPSSASDLDARLGAFDAPYIYRDNKHRQAVFDPFNSEPLKEINAALESDGVMLLTAYLSGYRVLTCNYPIYSLADLKGVKIRVVASDLYQQLFTAFGAAATPMAFSEVSTALVTHVIDGQENPYSVIAAEGLYEIQKYIMETNHLPTNHGVWMNLNTYNSLTPEQQDAVKKAAFDAVIECDAKTEERMEEYRQQCIDGGAEIITVENGLKLEEFEEAANSVYDYFKDQWGDMPDKIRAVGQ